MLAAGTGNDRLDEVADLVAEGRDGAAVEALGALHGDLDPDGGPEHFNTAIFAQALSLRAGHRPPSINLYLRDLDLAQIQLFNLLARHLPIVSLAGGMANELLAGYVAGRDAVTLLDLGIGTGQQEALLLRTLAERDALPGRIHVVGIEPSASSLREAEGALTDLGRELGLELRFTGVHALAEQMSDGDWAGLPVHDAGELVLNAAFAAHHIQATGAGPTEARDWVFGKLAALDPSGAVLIEPNSDHLEPDWRARFRNALWHYGTVLRLIDAVGAPHADTLAMKMFFAREVEDVIANSESTRAERHELTPTWTARLERSGLHLPQELPSTPVDSDVVSLVSGEGHRTVAFGEDPLVAVLCAGRAPSLADAGWVATRPEHAAVGRGSVISVSPAGATRVADVMHAVPGTVLAGATRAEAAAALHQTGASDLPVVTDDGRFVGVISEGDLLRDLLPSGGTAAESLVEEFELLGITGRARAPQRIDDLVITDPIVLAPDDDLLRVASVMIHDDIRRLPVVDDGHLVGSVSRADLCAALLGS